MPVVRRSSRGRTSRRNAAHAAVGVADAGAEEEVQDAGEHRVADVAVQPRHRARVDVVHPVAHDELGARVELLDEARDLVEVVGQVGVGHDDVVAARGGEAGQVGAAVAAARLVHDARAGRRRPARRCRPRSRCRRRRPRPAMPAAVDAGERRCDALLDVLGLVEAGDDDRDLRRRRGSSASRERMCLRRCSSAMTAQRCLAAVQATRTARKVARVGETVAKGLRASGCPCGSASSTTACSPTPSGAPSAGIATSPSGSPPTGTRSPT